MFNFVLLAGSNWNNEANCSSQSRNGNNLQSNVNANISRQGWIHRASELTLRLDILPCLKRQNTKQRGNSPSNAMNEKIIAQFFK